MKFKLTEPDEQFNVLKTVSTEGKWELGLWSVMFGVRVRLGRVGRGWCELDYCAGADPLFQIELFDAVRTILHDVPEDVNDEVIRKMFPDYVIKPINRDPVCWEAIQRMRDAALANGATEMESLKV